MAEHVTVPCTAATGLGVKREALLSLGVVWLLIGLGVVLGYSTPPPGVFFAYIPAQLRAGAWIVSGVFAAYAAVRMRGIDVATGLLVVMPLLRFLSYVVAWADSFIPGVGGDGYRAGWYTSLTYAGLLVAVRFAAHVSTGGEGRADR